MKMRVILVLLVVLTGGSASASPCRADRPRAEERSRELRRLVAKDQADRQDNKLDPGTIERDVARRKRVAAMNAKAVCPAESVCAGADIKDAPAGTVPGLW